MHYYKNIWLCFVTSQAVSLVIANVCIFEPQFPIMGVASALGLLLAIVCGMLAMGQVSDLQTISRSLTSGAVTNVMRTVTFIMLLVVGVTGVGAVLGALSWTLRR